MPPGQVCEVREYRGQHLVSRLYQHVRRSVPPVYDLDVTEIATRNEISVRAHATIGFERISTFSADQKEWAIGAKAASPMKVPSMKIREATSSELAVCARILESAWATAMPSLPRRVSSPELGEQTQGELVLVATLERDPVAFASVWKPSWFLHNLFVAPAHQRRGIGSSLIRFVSTLAGAHGVGLKCQAENRAALRFYARHGFLPTGLRGSDEFGEWLELHTRAG